MKAIEVAEWRIGDVATDLLSADYRHTGTYLEHNFSQAPKRRIFIGLEMVPGGRVELPTPAFSGPRSTGELPRHFGRQKILRLQGVRSKS
jgi:hypothetical protein